MDQFCDFFTNYNTSLDLYELVSGTITHPSASVRFRDAIGSAGAGGDVHRVSFTVPGFLSWRP